MADVTTAAEPAVQAPAQAPAQAAPAAAPAQGKELKAATGHRLDRQTERIV